MRIRFFGRIYTVSKRVRFLLCLLGLIPVVAVGSCLRDSDRKREALIPAHDTAFPSFSTAPLSALSTPDVAASPALIAVYVNGCVCVSGVYWVPDGTILNEVILMAGGLTDQACAETVNLALRVTDGMQIRIPSREDPASPWLLSGGTAGSSGSETKSGLVNLNTASLSELTSLSGIGESTAKAILAYRETHGAFSCIEEIMKVPGIKEARFEKIRNNITV